MHMRVPFVGTGHLCLEESLMGVVLWELEALLTVSLRMLGTIPKRNYRRTSREAFDEGVVVELKSETARDVDANCERILEWVKTWKEEHGSHQDSAGKQP
jgi:hypothetical protein